MRHYDILIVTKQQFNEEIFSGIDYLHLDSAIINEQYRCNDFSFDYLITDDINILKNFNLVSENNYYLTNCFFQSSNDEIFIIGNLNKSNTDYNYQLSTIVEFLTM